MNIYYYLIFVFFLMFFLGVMRYSLLLIDAVKSIFCDLIFFSFVGFKFVIIIIFLLISLLGV